MTWLLLLINISSHQVPFPHPQTDSSTSVWGIPSARFHVNCKVRSKGRRKLERTESKLQSAASAAKSSLPFGSASCAATAKANDDNLPSSLLPRYTYLHRLADHGFTGSCRWIIINPTSRCPLHERFRWWDQVVGPAVWYKCLRPGNPNVWGVFFHTLL